MKYTFEDIDERIIKTRIALTGAILTILSNNRKDTVLNICQEANITPMTYYHHFSNKQELYAYAAKQQLNLILPIPRKLKPTTIKGLVIYLINKICYLADRNKDLITNDIKTIQRFGANHSYLFVFIQVMNKHICDEIKIIQPGILQNQATFLCNTITSMIISAVLFQIKANTSYFATYSLTKKFIEEINA